jgi:hypothetical protein
VERPAALVDWRLLAQVVKKFYIKQSSGFSFIFAECVLSVQCFDYLPKQMLRQRMNIVFLVKLGKMTTTIIKISNFMENENE